MIEYNMNMNRSLANQTLILIISTLIMLEYVSVTVC